MAIDLSYQQVLHQVALRMNALLGSNVSEVTAAYDNPLTAVNFKSVDWPFNSFRDTIFMAVADFSLAIANTEDHVWRAYIGALTADLANHATLPSLASNGKEIIGVPGDVFDSVDGIKLERRPLDEVRRIVQETWRTFPLYYYHIGDGLRIEHTRTNVKIECCFYSRADQFNAWNGAGNVPLPSVLEPGIVGRTISLMTKDGAFEDQAGIYRKYSDEALINIRAGKTQMPDIKLP
jgi:hypothetical protein